jgi:hypothetical protein
MKNFSIRCSYCNTPAKIKGQYAYACCMCDDETRIVSLENIKSGWNKNSLYLSECQEKVYNVHLEQNINFP